MNQLTPLAMIGAAILTIGGVEATAASLLIDDFNQYVSGSYIQDQAGSRWTRFGTATNDGIYSVANPSPTQRAASYQATFNPTTERINGYVRYTFAAPVDLGEYYGFSLNLHTNTILPGTQVFAQISATVSGNTTVIETLVGQAVNSTTSDLYEFLFTEDNLRVIQGTLPVSAVMDNLISITFRFNNSVTTNGQAFIFDDLTALQAPDPVPEPSTMAMLLGVSVLGAFWQRQRRLKRSV